MKSYTDLPQSKKLAEILPLESADMVYQSIEDEYGDGEWESIPRNHSLNIGYDNDVRCWSLAALLNVIPKHIDEFNVLRIDISTNDFAIWYDKIGFGVNNDLPDITRESAVDACFEMIIHLHEQKLL